MEQCLRSDCNNVNLSLGNAAVMPASTFQLTPWVQDKINVAQHPTLDNTRPSRFEEENLDDEDDKPKAVLEKYFSIIHKSWD